MDGMLSTTCPMHARLAVAAAAPFAAKLSLFCASVHHTTPQPLSLHPFLVQLSKVQTAVDVVQKKMRHYDGSFVQFRCDEKVGTVAMRGSRASHILSSSKLTHRKHHKYVAWPAPVLNSMHILPPL